MPKNRAFVMGHPIGHSRSPMLHGHWLERLGIEGSYERLDVPPAELERFFRSYREQGWVGGNVTVPDKTAVISFLDRIDTDAKAMGAVNTIWWEGEELVGGNTDATGLLGNIDELVPGWDRTARRAVILGAGGAARAAVHGLLGRGLEVALCNRTFHKAEALVRHFGGRVTAHRFVEREALLRDCDLLVNMTSLGMVNQPPLEIDLSPLPERAVVYDVIYVPLETDLLKQAKARGHRTVDGLGMLLHQAVEGFGRWFGRRPQVTAELRQILVDDIRARDAGRMRLAGNRPAGRSQGRNRAFPGKLLGRSGGEKRRTHLLAFDLHQTGRKCGLSVSRSTRVTRVSDLGG